MGCIRMTTNMKGFQRWMKEHPRKRVDGYFTLGDREMTHEEIKKMVDYAVLMGYRTEADIPEEELAKVLGLKGGGNDSKTSQKKD